MVIYREEGGLLFARSERKIPVLEPALQSDQSLLCDIHSSSIRNRGGGGPNGQIVTTKGSVDGRRQRTRKIINEEREKQGVKNGSLRNISTDSKEVSASAPIRKERLSPTSKARREASRNEFVEKGGVLDRVKN